MKDLAILNRLIGLLVLISLTCSMAHSQTIDSTSGTITFSQITDSLSKLGGISVNTRIHSSYLSIPDSLMDSYRPGKVIVVVTFDSSCVVHDVQIHRGHTPELNRHALNLFSKIKIEHVIDDVVQPDCSSMKIFRHPVPIIYKEP